MFELFVQEGADELQEISEMDARLIRATLFFYYRYSRSFHRIE